MALLDVTPEMLRRLYDGSEDRAIKALLLWAVHHGYWIAADGSNTFTLMEPKSWRTRFVNRLRFMGLLPWKSIPEVRA